VLPPFSYDPQARTLEGIEAITPEQRREISQIVSRSLQLDRDLSGLYVTLRITGLRRWGRGGCWLCRPCRKIY